MPEIKFVIGLDNWEHYRELNDPELNVAYFTGINDILNGIKNLQLQTGAQKALELTFNHIIPASASMLEYAKNELAEKQKKAQQEDEK